jgi:hypothetical protein
MNWEAIGAISEIIGATAVVITLIYLAVQIKDGTKIARSSTRQAIADSFMTIGSDVIADKELADLLVKDLKGAELGEVDRLRLYARSYVGMRHWENVHYQFLTGMLADDEWQGLRHNLEAMLQWKTVQTYWDNESQYFSSSFQAEVAKIQQELTGKSSGLSHGYVIGKPDRSLSEKS